ncbi:MAG: ABC transporter substrate-binding protein [Gammaproteobacteria bacterium]|nr:ABC transporter substrate-binding protein [Gammaproteobacteria bacterium]HXK57947.1 ABC transporter substrate-binding protein [Gammaproteobacteria bacterium]
MKNRFLILIVLAAGFGAPASAQPYYPESVTPYGFSRQIQQPGPAVILRQGLKKLMAFAGGERRPSRIQAEAFLEREIAPYFDFAYMASWAVGDRMWQRIGREQQAELVAQIKQDFLTTLATRLTGFGDQQVQVLRPRGVSENEVMVGVSILNPQAYPARLNFRFYRAEDGWKVFDVSANGNSAVMHYRNQFRRMMRERMIQQRGFGR